MPRRWLSVRGQKDSKDVVNVIQDQFDFEFNTTTHDPVSPLTPVTPKASMFTSSPFRSRKNKNLSLRPQSSNGPKATVDKRLHLAKVDDSWIGLAIGSPTHPPNLTSGYSPNDSEPSTKDAFNTDGPLFPGSSTLGRYKKLGNLFKSKSGPVTISSPTNVYKIDGDQKIGMPIARKPLPNSKVLPDWINAENPESFTVPDEPTKASFEDKPLPRPAPLPLPKLEIQIPNAGMDRYSVMFSNVSGIKPSSLLERRSRLHIANAAIHEQAEAPPIPPVALSQTHRPTTPTQHRRTSSYSLFPSPPKSKGSLRSSPDRSLPQRQLSYSSRPSTAPECSASPPKKCITKSDIHRVTPQRKDSEMSFASPDETVASSVRDDSPWRSNESLPSAPSSRTSVGSEIFFDLKPAVDCNGREQSQYVFQEPEPAVELAMSNSRKARRARNRSREENRPDIRMSPDLQAAEYMINAEQKWRLSLELNQAIADVERLTSPSNSDSSPVEMVEIEASSTKLTPQSLLPPVTFRRRLDGLAIGIPSPITERSEEFSPRLSPVKALSTHPRQHIASLCIRPAPLNVSSESIAVIEEYAITPPPVPVKDAKYIPIAKVTATDSSVKLVEHHPKRQRPKHAATSTSAKPKRSRSVDLRRQYEKLHVDNASKPLNEINRKRLPSDPSKRIESGIIAISVKPTTEVAVARTVSLERKQSHQILVSSPKTRSVDHLSGNITLSPSRCMSPTFHEGKKTHQPGASFDLVVETSVAERRKRYES